MKIKDRATPIDFVVVVIGANGFVGLETSMDVRNFYKLGIKSEEPSEM